MDLPEPKPRGPRSELELAELRWKLFSLLNALLLTYGIIHKVLIPIGRSLNKHNPTPIDWFWTFYLLLAVLIYLRDRKYLFPLMALGLGYSLYKFLYLPYGYMLLHKKISWEWVSIFMTEGLGILYFGYFLAEFKSTKKHLGFVFLGVFLAHLVRSR